MGDPVALPESLAQIGVVKFQVARLVMYVP